MHVIIKKLTFNYKTAAKLLAANRKVREKLENFPSYIEELEQLKAEFEKLKKQLIGLKPN
jgi:hypothetical protein